MGEGETKSLFAMEVLIANKEGGIRLGRRDDDLRGAKDRALA